MFVSCNYKDNITWNHPQEATCLLRGMQIWRVQIPNCMQLLAKTKLLPEKETSRAAKYAKQKDKDRYIISRLVLRKLLSRYSGRPFHEIIISDGKNNKPFSPGSGIHFNIAYSGHYILIAIAEREVGLDMELISENFDYTGVSATFFSTEERAYIAQSINPLIAFYKLWTRKEALLKYTAQGINDNIAFAPAIDGIHNGERVFIGKEGVVITTFEMGERYMCSVATEPSISRVLYFNWEE